MTLVTAEELRSWTEVFFEMACNEADAVVIKFAVNAGPRVVEGGPSERLS